MDIMKIQEKMDVVGACGTRLGMVDHLDVNAIKLARLDRDSGGVHHTVPLEWVERVDSLVHLNRDADVVRSAWVEDEAAAALS